MAPSRSRSISRSRVVSDSSLFTSGKALNPHALLEDILPKLNTTDIPLHVVISDGTDSVNFLLNIFLSKEYEVIDEKVIFGFKKLSVGSLRCKIEFNIQLEQ